MHIHKLEVPRSVLWYQCWGIMVWMVLPHLERNHPVRHSTLPQHLVLSGNDHNGARRAVFCNQASSQTCMQILSG